MHNNKAPVVYVGLSGGVDSSVSAYLLLQAGYTVVGVFIKAWQPDFLPCTWKEDRQSAMRVAAHLGIPFKTFDLGAEYKREVFDRMVDAYSRGQTPNPDVWCNEKIKFGLFLERALQDGAMYVATGHYAVRKEDSSGKARMHLSKDTEKDQTYFLSRIGQEALERSLFPIGGYTKEEVRTIARDAGLPTAERKDSQGLCFVGALDMKDFLRETIPHVSGEVRTSDGTVIGAHDGISLYTIGERHGFQVTTSYDNQNPYFVIDKKVAENALIVGDRASLVSLKQLKVVDIRLNTDTALAAGDELDIRYRYRQPFVRAVVTSHSAESCTLTMSDAVEQVAQGQVVALYRNGICLGGGFAA